MSYARLSVFFVILTFYTRVVTCQQCLKVVPANCGGDPPHRGAFAAVSSDRGLPGKKGPKGSRGEVGVKGEPGVSVDHEGKITDLESQLSVLRGTLVSANAEIDKLKAAVTKLTTDFDAVEKMNTTLEALKERVAVYEIRKTPREGTFDEVKRMCIDMKGQLIQSGLSMRTDEHSRRVVAQMVSSTGGALWIGVTDIESHNKWRYLNGDIFNDAALIYQWDGGQPQNNHERCAGIQSGSSTFHDYSCSRRFFGVCEIKIEF